jgi:hypothetical protein
VNGFYHIAVLAVLFGLLALATILDAKDTNA